MGLRGLSEAIILQAASDLLDTPRDKDSLEFFSGEGFGICAEIVKMDHDDKIRFLTMLTECISKCREKGTQTGKEPELTVRRESKDLIPSDRFRRSQARDVA